MSAKVEILIDERPNVLAIPVNAVIQRGRRGICYVKTRGAEELRHIQLGPANETHVEVTSGLTAGDRVVLALDTLDIPPRVIQELEAGRDEPVLVALDPLPGGGTAPLEEIDIEYQCVLLADGSDAIGEIEVEFRMVGAEYVKKEVEVTIQKGPPGAVWEVVVDGIRVGSVTLDEYGAVEKKEWSTKDGSLAADFPTTIGPGASVVIGDTLRGELQP